jgi:hypothetical protein
MAKHIVDSAATTPTTTVTTDSAAAAATTPTMRHPTYHLQDVNGSARRQSLIQEMAWWIGPLKHAISSKLPRLEGQTRKLNILSGCSGVLTEAYIMEARMFVLKFFLVVHALLF